ncbi:hypothetical protein BP5796_01230 [Coleophoma crateriformis]|uniref:Uncharacterized protein n=1 Tax=Coleophoma crateriformis TaxID=565419 RepID=A0A3D8SZV7_9HELO|nr:hypothetical protein BP5796_01230 [Coleophoma crateriformis]
MDVRAPNPKNTASDPVSDAQHRLQPLQQGPPGDKSEQGSVSATEPFTTRRIGWLLSNVGSCCSARHSSSTSNASTLKDGKARRDGAKQHTDPRRYRPDGSFYQGLLSADISPLVGAHHAETDEGTTHRSATSGRGTVCTGRSVTRGHGRDTNFVQSADTREAEAKMIWGHLGAQLARLDGQARQGGEGSQHPVFFFAPLGHIRSYCDPIPP